MSYYGFCVTEKGRNLIAKLIVGEKLSISKVAVGKGVCSDEINPKELSNLIDTVALATSTVPTYDRGCVKMTVEYRSDLNGGLTEGFWLSEVGVFAKDPDDGEIMLCYGSLGEYPQYVNALSDTSIDVRRFPITIAVGDDMEVSVDYTCEAWVTAEEFNESNNVLHTKLDTHTVSDFKNETGVHNMRIVNGSFQIQNDSGEWEALTVANPFVYEKKNAEGETEFTVTTGGSGVNLGISKRPEDYEFVEPEGWNEWTALKQALYKVDQYLAYVQNKLYGTNAVGLDGISHLDDKGIFFNKLGGEELSSYRQDGATINGDVEANDVKIKFNGGGVHFSISDLLTAISEMITANQIEVIHAEGEGVSTGEFVVTGNEVKISYRGSAYKVHKSEDLLFTIPSGCVPDATVYAPLTAITDSESNVNLSGAVKVSKNGEVTIHHLPEVTYPTRLYFQLFYHAEMVREAAE